MVPLTSSLYVPGQLDDTQNVMIEVGAGYFIEKDIAGASNYCERKMKALEESQQKVGQLVNTKKLNLQKV